MNTAHLKPSLLAGAARLRSGMQACLFEDDPPAATHRYTEASSRSDLVLFTVFAVLVSLAGAWILYLESALSRTGMY